MEFLLKSCTIRSIGAPTKPEGLRRVMTQEHTVVLSNERPRYIRDDNQGHTHKMEVRGAFFVEVKYLNTEILRVIYVDNQITITA